MLLRATHFGFSSKAITSDIICKRYSISKETYLRTLSLRTSSSKDFHDLKKDNVDLLFGNKYFMHKMQSWLHLASYNIHSSFFILPYYMLSLNNSKPVLNHRLFPNQERTAKHKQSGSPSKKFFFGDMAYISLGEIQTGSNVAIFCSPWYCPCGTLNRGL